MKFFEFNRCDYYALIGAASKEKAISDYNEEVSELNDEYAGPDEVSEEYARAKYAKAGYREAEMDFNSRKGRAKPEIFLISSDLI